MIKYIPLLLFMTVLTISCTSIENPTLERIEDVDIISLSTTKIELNANMILNNPNVFALDLAEANLKAIVDDIELAHIQQTYDTEMEANKEFKMPVSINLAVNKLYQDNPLLALSKGMKIMSEKKITIRFVGNIRVGKGSAKVNVPIDQLEVVEF